MHADTASASPPRKTRSTLLVWALSLFSSLSASLADASPERPRLLFLGDQGHHRPSDRFRQIRPVLADRGIDLVYTERLADLNESALEAYDGLVVFANVTELKPEQEKALLDFVASGKGFVPLHCASFCFLNSDEYLKLVGARFARHGTGVFRTKASAPKHPIMKGFQTFESWDETYVHERHQESGREVLEVRDEEGRSEPWTWTKTHGKGRVFYTAWGHDGRTWGHPGFHNLLERGIRWAVGGDPGLAANYADRPPMSELHKDVKPFSYVPAKVPFYPPSERWGTIGEPFARIQAPLTPEESIKHIVAPIDFAPRLYAAEPAVSGKPICVNWDERGRLWIGLTVDYPNEKRPEGQGRDKIVICEDVDHDGVADKFTTFADKLSIVTSIAFTNGGAIVHQPPQTLFLRDANGDDVADERKVIFDGWSTADTHAGPSNIRYGLDGWFYGIVGYSGFEGTVAGERRSFRTGFYRFKPDGSALEFLRNTNNNSWGVGFSEEGLLFGSTANNNPSEYLPIPNRYYESVRGWSSRALNGIALDSYFDPITENVRQVDHHGKFTAGAGHALYTARKYPKSYWNRTAFVAEPTGHLVATFTLQPDGSAFHSRNSWNLIAGDDEWFAPIIAEVGPDGYVWVVDWYNIIVQHNPTPAGYRTGKGNAYEIDLRDKSRGRVYRLETKGAKPDPPFSLAGASPAKLVETLKNDNQLWRNHAQRLLIERGDRDVLPSLVKLAGDPSVDEIGLNVGAIHAIRTLQALGALDSTNGEGFAAAVACLKHKSAGVRRNAVAALPASEASVRAILDSGIVDDPDAIVRLAAFLALADMPSNPAAGSAIARVLGKDENARDRWLPDALTAAAAAHSKSFLGALASNREPLGPKAIEVATIVAEHFARGGPDDELPAAVASLGNAEPRLAEALLTGMARGRTKSRPVKLSADEEKAIVTLFDRLSPAGKGSIVTLAESWGTNVFEKYTSEIVASLKSMMNDQGKSDDVRIDAARRLIGFRRRDSEAVRALLEAITPRTSPAAAAAIVESLSASEAPNLGEIVVERLGKLAPSTRPAAIRVLLSRPEASSALIRTIETGRVALTELSLDQRQALTAHPDASLAQRARRLLAQGGGLPDADRKKVIDALMPATIDRGDVANGKTIFKNNCAKCHTHGGEGNRVGPDLSGTAAHPKSELIQHILDPSKDVEGNYRVYTAVTSDGRVLNGLLASESRTSIELIDSEGKSQTLQREDVEELIASTKSLMPEGFEKQVSRKDLTDLLEFLTAKGKYLPLPLDKIATVVSTRGMFNSETATAERLNFGDWTPKTFADVPFILVDPKGDRVPNALLLNGPQGRIPPRMPKSVTLPCNTAVKSVHILGGVSGWGYPLGEKGSISMIVRLRYEDGKVEDHPLRNGEHLADYIRRVDVPGSRFAFDLRGRQIRYLSISPGRPDVIRSIELVKGSDATAPVVMAVTVETR